MYDVEKMRRDLEIALAEVYRPIRDEFAQAFRDIYRGAVVPDEFDSSCAGIMKHTLTRSQDLSQLTTGAGFYLILSTFPIPNNGCTLTSSGLRAIYRGECATVQRRIQSHLFNRQYIAQYEQRRAAYERKPENSGRTFYEQYWPACLSLEKDVSGINIDSEPYSAHAWLVIVHPMRGSTQEIRKQAEVAFDDVFGRPAASREASR
jgi:hypothetical protein